MIWALLITAAIVAVSGLALKRYAPQVLGDSYWHISWQEYVAGVLAMYIVAMPLVFLIGKAWSVSDALTYQEFYNGVETSATVQVSECRPGQSGQSAASGHSNCDHEYRTGETYIYTETYTVTVSDGCDDSGCHSHTEVRTRAVTGYIYNPYATHEYTYKITDSIGGTYAFPGTYVKDGEAFAGRSIPANIPRGDPKEWLDARQHLDAGNPRPVTRLFHYDNYILASQDELLNPFSEDVDRYLEEEILPEHTENITENPLYGFSESYADKVRFVGVDGVDESAWQAALMQFDAALGTELQGDLHLVLIDAALVDNATTYMNALKAYWLGDAFGRRAIAKNAIIVVAAVQDGQVAWAQASTGMPFGNEVMLTGIQNFLPGTPLTPDQVIGAPRTVVTLATGEQDDTSVVTLSDTPGVLERVVLQDFPFERACMDCINDGEQVGYKDLVVKVQPKPWQWAVMATVVVVLSSIYWMLAGRYELFNWVPGVRTSQPDRRNFYSDRYDDLYRPTRNRRR